MICLSSSVLRPRWWRWWYGVDVRRWWQPCFDDDRWGRRQIIAAVSNSLFPFPVSRFIATWLVPCTPPFARSVWLLISTLSTSSSLATSLYIFTPSHLLQKSTPFTSTCLSCRLLFSLPPSVWFPEKEKAGSFSPLSDGGGWWKEGLMWPLNWVR